MAGDEVVAPQEFLPNVHSAFEGGEVFVEPVHFHTMFNPLKCVVFFVDVGRDCSSRHFEFGVAHVVATVLLHFCKGRGVFKSVGRLSQSVVGSPCSLEEFEEPVGEGGSGAL